MTDDRSQVTGGIIVPREGSPMLLCVKSYDSLLGVAYFKATPEDLAAAGYQKAGTDAEHDAAISALEAANARIDELEAELAAKDACWHCKDALWPTKPRCEVCPEECDDEACSEEGCREDRDQALRAKPSPAMVFPENFAKTLDSIREAEKPSPAVAIGPAISPKPENRSLVVQHQAKPSPAGEKDPPELCPVVGCGCDGCTYCHDNHDEQTRCSCQCEYYRAPPAPVEAPLTNDWREKVVTVGMLADVLGLIEQWGATTGAKRAVTYLERIAKGGAR